MRTTYIGWVDAESASVSQRAANEVRTSRKRSAQADA